MLIQLDYAKIKFLKKKKKKKLALSNVCMVKSNPHIRPIFLFLFFFFLSSIMIICLAFVVKFVCIKIIF